MSRLRGLGLWVFKQSGKMDGIEIWLFLEQRVEVQQRWF